MRDGEPETFIPKLELILRNGKLDEFLDGRRWRSVSPYTNFPQDSKIVTGVGRLAATADRMAQARYAYSIGADNSVSLLFSTDAASAAE